jgi:hypothetical protein
MQYKHGFEASLGYIVRPWLKCQKTNKGNCIQLDFNDAVLLFYIFKVTLSFLIDFRDKIIF